MSGVETQVVEVQVTKHAYAAAQALTKFAAAVKQALADGWQPGQDMASIIGAGMTDLVPAIADLVALPAEHVADPTDFAAGILLGAKGLLDVVKTPVAPTAAPVPPATPTPSDVVPV